MPDPPISSKRPRLVERPTAEPAQDPYYCELHCKTNFSFLEGASHPDELALRAAELGLAGLAITDRNSLAGVVRRMRPLGNWAEADHRRRDPSCSTLRRCYCGPRIGLPTAACRG